MSEKKLFNDEDVLKCANMAIGLQKENARLKELNCEMVEAINQLVNHIKQEHNLNSNDEIYCPHIKHLAYIAEKAKEDKYL